MACVENLARLRHIRNTEGGGLMHNNNTCCCMIGPYGGRGPFPIHRSHIIAVLLPEFQKQASIEMVSLPFLVTAGIQSFFVGCPPAKR